MSDAAPTSAKGQSGTWRAALGSLAGVALLPVILLATPFLTSLAPTAERTLYFKLPIEGVRYHWRFLDADAFLSGELTLRILNKDRDQTIVVFRDGKIHDGWEVVDDTRPNDGFYFGLATTNQFPTKADDSLVITLKVPRDLHGKGPYTEGVLAAGVWQMTGTYSSMYGRRWNPLDIFALGGDPPVAYMQCWKDVWPITITKLEGWKGARPNDEVGLLRRLVKERGTNGDVCGSHI